MFIEGRDGRADGDVPEADYVPWFACNGAGCHNRVFDQEGDCPVHGTPLVEIDDQGHEVTT